ncbi:Transposon Ty3-I Gag-Pol polyprotein [Mizuhopecten yessoensis]|uniref:Transposon Ty3-I Gag-Pol polyprotein n=1 Tax=Mizuhopecten yessoensis TaxID=6573 RepID=A0A210R635_MIZYE|nr:Transposon Ty3-I Gag-Pol polyprotein [Mizuhopecten yessoensis]
MINYLARFVPDLSSRAVPLRKLLVKDNAWIWEQPQERAFEELKTLVSNEPVLKFYDPTKEIRVSADASQTGLGAVLLQKHDSEWLPVAYASRTVTECESRYATIEREALALTFACERFHQYVYGTTFEVETDHKPLVAIFAKAFNGCPPRIQRMRLRLQKYDFRLSHTPGRYMYTADTLSRASVKDVHDDSTKAMNHDVEMYVDCIYKSLPVTDAKLDEIRRATQQDGTMNRLARVIVDDWPDERHDCTSDMFPYWNFREELTVINGLVFKGTRIVIPLKLRSEMLKKIHHGHLGREKCKKRASELLFWPNMNFEINSMVENCDVCQKFAMKQQAEPLNPTPVSKSAWEHVSTDLFSLEGKDYIVTCDSFSNYPEVLLLPNQTATSVINALKSIFSRHGVPQVLTSDNGPCYSCKEFKDFVKEWDIKHVTSSPRYPQSNGLAEKTVQTVKNIMRKCKESQQDIHMALLVYRTTPLDNGLSPAELLMGRRLKSNLPEARVDVKRVDRMSDVIKWREGQNNRQKYYYDRRNHVKSQDKLTPGDQVRIQEPQSWSDRASVVSEVGPRSYLIRRNRKHLKLIPDVKTDDDVIKVQESERCEPDQTHVSDHEDEVKPAPVIQPGRTKSGRTINRPQRLIEQC